MHGNIIVEMYGSTPIINKILPAENPMTAGNNHKDDQQVLSVK